MNDASKSPECAAQTKEKRSKRSNDDDEQQSREKRAKISNDESVSKGELVVTSKDVSTVVADSKNVSKVEANSKKKLKKREVTTRCRPGQLIELINLITKEQRDSICDMGFGGLLKLKVSDVPHAIIPLLINAFSPGSHMFKASETKQFLLSKHDIHDMFLLPITENPVKLAPTGRMKGSKDVVLKQYWRDEFNIKDNKSSIPLNWVYNRILANKEANDEFKKLFVWYSMSIFFAPTSNYALDFALVDAIEDVSKIGELDWCDFVFESLVSAIKPLSNKESKSFLCGCVLFLMLTYFHRFDFRGVAIEHSLPLIQHWDNKKLEERVKLELSSKGLGDAPLSSVSFPIYLNLPDPNVSASSRPHVKPAVPKLTTSHASRPDVDGRREKKTMLVDLPDDAYTDEEIAVISSDDVQKFMMFIQRDFSVFDMRYQMWIKAIKATVSANVGDTGGESLDECRLSPTQPIFHDPNFHEFLDNVERYNTVIKDILRNLSSFDQLSQVNRTIKEAVNSRGLDSEKEKEVNFDNDDYHDTVQSFSAPSLDELLPDTQVEVDNQNESSIHVDVDVDVDVDVSESNGDGNEGTAVVCGVSCLDKVGVDVDICVSDGDGNEGTPVVCGISCIDKVVSDICGRLLKEKESCISEEKNKSTIESGVEFEVTDIDDCGNGGDLNFWLDEDKAIYGLSTPPLVNEEGCSIVVNEEVCEDVGVSYSYVVGTSYMLHCHEYEITMCGVPHHLGCTIDCGLFLPNMIVLSRTLIEKKNVSMQMLSVRKQVVDYSLLDDYEFGLEEVLVEYGGFNFLSRENFVTLKPGEELDTCLFENWCLNLNALFQAMNDGTTPSRFCVGLHYASSLAEMCRNPEKPKSLLVDQIFHAFTAFLESSEIKIKLDTDMVFIPMLAFGHFSCVCINFTKQQVEYLDNRSYDFVIEKTNYGLYARTIADVMACYLCNNGVIKAAKVHGFKLVNIPFEWQLHYDLAGKIDCGVYTMLHMLFYVGELFDCGLGNEECRNVYRAEISATLILSDLNTVRDQVLDKVETLEGKKELLLPKLVEKRKLIDEEQVRKDEEEARKAVSATEAGGLHNEKVDGKDTFCTPVANASTVRSVESVSPRTVICSRMRGEEGNKGDGLGCSLNQGEANDSMLVVSKFLRSNQALFSKTLSLRKEVIDYCFLDDYDLKKDEFLVVIGEHRHLVREDILSMHPTVPMDSQFIDCWALLLNNLEFKEKGSPTAFYFGLRHNDALTSLYESQNQSTPSTTQMDRLVEHWDFFLNSQIDEPNLDVDLIFIPLKLADHYFCVCINFISQSIELLDDRLYKGDIETTDAMKLAILVAGCMSDYLDIKGVKQDSNLVCFESIQIKFDWQSYDNRDFESGCFLMMNMACYDGEVYESKLRMKVNRRLYGAEMIATLVLADINSYRNKVHDRVRKFVVEKPAFWDILKHKRNPPKKGQEKEIIPKNKRQLKVKDNAEAETELDPKEVAANETSTALVDVLQPLRSIKRHEGAEKSYTRFKIVSSKKHKL